VSIPEKRLHLLLRDLKICTRDFLDAWERHIRDQERVALPDPDSGYLPESLTTRLFSKKTTMPAGEFLLFFFAIARRFPSTWGALGQIQAGLFQKGRLAGCYPASHVHRSEAFEFA